MNIKKIILSVLLSGALLQCDGAIQSKTDPAGDDLAYGNLTDDDLYGIQRKVEHQFQ